MEGCHWMATLRNVQIMSPVSVKSVVENALKQSGGTIVGYTEHLFPNGAITFCFLLAESHCTVHTYPELHSMWMDCFTCGEAFDTKKFQQMVILGLASYTTESKIVYRN